MDEVWFQSYTEKPWSHPKRVSRLQIHQKPDQRLSVNGRTEWSGFQKFYWQLKEASASEISRNSSVLNVSEEAS